MNMKELILLNNQKMILISSYVLSIKVIDIYKGEIKNGQKSEKYDLRFLSKGF